MRRAAAVLLVFVLAACGPETVRATGAPITTRPAATNAAPSPTPAPTTTASRAPTASAAPTAATPTASATATTASPTPAASPTVAPAGSPVLGACASESSLRSQPATTTTVPLLVVNDAGARRDLSALDASGRRVLAKTLAAGESYTQTTHVGEVWLVTDAGGTCAAIYSVVAPALLIVSASRNSLLPLYAIRGRVTDAGSSAPLPGQTVFIWYPDESSCAIIGGSGAPGYVVSSISAADGTYGVYVTAGEYKVRVRTAPVGGVSYAPQWWRGKPASTAGQCAAADVIVVNADATAIDFALQRQ